MNQTTKRATAVRAAIAQVWADVDPAEGHSEWWRMEGIQFFLDATQDRRVAIEWARQDAKAPVHKWRLR